MNRSPTAERLEGISLLSDAVRRRLYLYVVGQPGDVSRESAARAVGITRPAATFHLEKLVEGGLLEAGYRRLTGRQGPGAGRPAKVYRRSPRDVNVQIPPRDYELVARFLLSGLDSKRPGKAHRQAHRAAREFGMGMGAEARRRAGRHPSRGRLLDGLTEVLEERGFEPQADHGALRLRNCPFDALSSDYREVVCPMNLSMMQGVAEGLGLSHLEAVPDPKQGTCCVAFKPKARK